MAKSSRFKGSYVAAASVAAAAGTGVFADLTGANAKTVRLKKVRLSGFVLTDVGYLTVLLKKTSTVATGGTAVALLEAPLSSGYPAASAVGRTFTAAPTAGTPIGNIATGSVMGQDATAAAAALPATLEFVFPAGDEPILESAAESFSLQFDAAPATAVTVNVEFAWEEEGV
jgi:hypothetical protein